jgi:hypothetical protein
VLVVAQHARVSERGTNDAEEQNGSLALCSLAASALEQEEICSTLWVRAIDSQSIVVP